jgi:hypothetical protein
MKNSLKSQEVSNQKFFPKSVSDKNFRNRASLMR